GVHPKSQPEVRILQESHSFRSDIQNVLDVRLAGGQVNQPHCFVRLPRYPRGPILDTASPSHLQSIETVSDTKRYRMVQLVSIPVAPGKARTTPAIHRWAHHLKALANHDDTGSAVKRHLAKITFG